MDSWHNLDRAAVEARQDEARLDSFVSENKRFILRCASKTCKRFISESDEEFEIALSAFMEAVRTFDAEAGGFNGYASLMIRQRLLDHFDRLHRRRREASSSDAATETRRAIVSKALDPEHTLKDEIEAVSGILRGYGFSYFDVAEASPKSKKDRSHCARAVGWMLGQPARIDKLRLRHSLPVMELSTACEISHKIVDRHRRYIIAAAEILAGDFPQLAAYLQYIKKDKRT